MNEGPEALSELQRRDPMLAVRFDDRSATVRHLRGNLAELGDPERQDLRSAGLRFLDDHPDLFGRVDTGGMSVLEETTDPRGGRSVTLQQYYGPHLVYGGSIRFHATREGIIDTIQNRLFPDLDDVPLEPEVAREEAVRVAQRATGSDAPPPVEPRLLVYRYEGEPRLVWEVRLRDSHPANGKRRDPFKKAAPAQWIAYVDAVRGEPLVFFDNLKTAGPIVADGTGVYSGAGELNAWFNDVTNQLRDTTRTTSGGPEVQTDDEDGAAPSEDGDANWNDLTTSPRHQNQGAEVDSHRFTGRVVDYFRTVHARNSYDGAGTDVNVTVHYLTDEDNAYWDDMALRLLIGDGSGGAPGFDYLCTDDVIAHEFTHAVTQFTCNLQYLDESGALNEAFSDIFAAFVTGDWLVGEDCWLSPTAPALRNMIDPTNGGQWDPADPITSVIAGHQPSHYSVRYVGPIDNGGVHINSGIINHLFFLLTVGGTHAVSGITVSGIGQSAAESLLWRCMSDHLVGNPTADFLDFREAMLDACQELFPADLFILTQVKRAFHAVGIGPALAITFKSATVGAMDSVDTITIPVPGGLASGDVLIASIDVRGGHDPTTPAGWTPIRIDRMGSVIRKATYHHVVADPASEPASYRRTIPRADTPRTASGGILAYSDVDPATPINAHGGKKNETNSSAATAPSITTTDPNTMLVALFGSAKATTFTPPAGMSERLDNQAATFGTGEFKVSSEAADQAQAAVGSTGARIATAAVGGRSIGHLLALRPA